MQNKQQQTKENLLDFLVKKEKEIKEQLNQIPMVFNDLQDSEDYNYFNGMLDVVNEIKIYLVGETIVC